MLVVGSCGGSKTGCVDDTSEIADIMRRHGKSNFYNMVRWVV